MAGKNKNPAPRNVEAIARDNQLNSPLLHLPAELRNRIYHFTFDTNEVVLILPGYKDPPGFYSPPPTSNPLGLAQTCTQCRYEALPYFWKTTVFQLGYDVYLSGSFEFASQAVIDQIQIIRYGDRNDWEPVRRLSQNLFLGTFAVVRKVLMQQEDKDTSSIEMLLRRNFGKDIEICYYND
ncbi:hypothetical protein AA0111_g9708 [Alternaria arborescens]|uniref:hypothetical protein n=1 Tax=Alternaria arborescens TaxID=156630 RepID=UPI001075879D|nr:hypothetical protein AA0111_g9708 [Alternaria arborescens]RYO21275.1 hypothetical protein AA0111_g9708 [Alternaria arborescens]